MTGGFSKWPGNHPGKTVKLSPKKDTKFNYCTDSGYQFIVDCCKSMITYSTVSFSDALHTYFGLCGMSLMQEPGLNSIHAALNITQRAANHLNKLHKLMNR